jgi:hypothetical protein
VTDQPAGKQGSRTARRTYTKGQVGRKTRQAAYDKAFRNGDNRRNRGKR